jgi:hypothetical protein
MEAICTPRQVWNDPGSREIPPDTRQFTDEIAGTYMKQPLCSIDHTIEQEIAVRSRSGRTNIIHIAAASSPAAAAFSIISDVILV